MTLLASIALIPYGPLGCALARHSVESLKVKPITTPPALAMRLKIHCFLALQLEYVDTSVVTEDLKIVRDQIDHYINEIFGI